MRLLIIGLALGPGYGARAESLAAKRQELVSVQKQLEAARREIDEDRRLEESLSHDLEKLETSGVEARRKMGDLEGSMRSAEKRRSELRAKLSALGQASGFWRSELDSQVRRYAAERRLADAAFGTRELRVEDLSRAAIYEKAQMLGRLKGYSRKTQEAADETAARARRLSDDAHQALAAQASRQQQYQATVAAIAQAQQRRAEAMRRAKELQESAQALTRLMRSLGRARRRKQGAGARPQTAAHSLPWPADGSVARPFGRQRNPELGTWMISQGLLLFTPPSAPVTPIESGRVIFAGPFRSYGEVLILDHGSNFFSIYGDLGKILAAKGAQVGPKDTIALAGPGGLGGGSVYLEIRRGTEALDPALWLKPR